MIIEVNNLSKDYGNFKLNDVSFNVPYGSIVGLIGENGAGKTTIIKAIMNIIKKDSGEVKLFNQAMEDEDILIRDRIGIVFDSSNYYEKLNGKQINSILKDIYYNWNEELFKDLLVQFKIDINQPIKSLSKGMNMKFNIATALAQEPALLILDEPTSGLDPISRAEILDIFLEFIQDENHAILFSSHITTDLEKVADYITFIHEGNLIFTESKDTLIYEYGIIKCGEHAFSQIEKEDIVSYKKLDYQYEVLVENKDEISKKYGHLNKFIIDSPSIDDIMLLYIKGQR